MSSINTPPDAAVLSFTTLRPGLQKTLAITRYEKSEMGSKWQCMDRHEVVYVNKHDKEVLIRMYGSKLYVLAAQQFDEKGYTDK